MGGGEIEQKVERLAGQIVEDLGLEIVLVEYSERGNGRLRLVIDKPGGVSLDDCAEASRRLGAVLDVEDPVPRSYELEVSSPGLDRPLVRPEDYDRFSGRRAVVKTAMPLDGRRVFRGRLMGRSGEKKDLAVLELADGSGSVEIPLSAVAQARLEVEDLVAVAPRSGGRPVRRKGGFGRK